MKKLLFILTMTIIWSGMFAAPTYSLEFDGIDDWVDCGNDPSITEFDQFTIEAWVWLQDSSYDQKIVNKWKFSTDYYIMGVYDGSFYCQINANGNDFSFLEGTVPSQEWTHLALLFQKGGGGGNNGYCFAYVNGELVFSKDDVADEPIDVNYPAYPFRIGAASWDSNAYLVDGKIDEVRIWNYRRYYLDIPNFMETSLDGDEAGLVAYYPMSNGSSFILDDDSPNSNTGYLYDGGVIGNGPVWVDDSFTPEGYGTFELPYLISELRHLYWLSLNPDAFLTYSIYSQTTDIDAEPTEAWEYHSSGMSPIGDPEGVSLNGIYYGNGHTIDNLNIHSTEQTGVGLFAKKEDGVIQGLGLNDVIIWGDEKVGGLVGILSGDCIIMDCYATGDVLGNLSVGGLVGTNEGPTSYITECYADCSVQGDDWGAYNLGGLVGTNSSDIYLCYSGSTVGYGDNYAGGFVGVNTETGNITNCYSDGQAKAGFVGNNHLYGTIDACYSRAWVGTVTGWGFLMGDDMYVTNCFWDFEVSECATSDGGTPKNTAAMTNVATYTQLGNVGLDYPWDFAGNPYDDTNNEDYWDIDPETNDGYPYFSLQNPPLNVNIYADETVVGIWWDEVEGASAYRIYSSSDPYEPVENWTFEAEVMITSWSEPVFTNEKKFYYVTAMN